MRAPQDRLAGPRIRFGRFEQASSDTAASPFGSDLPLGLASHGGKSSAMAGTIRRLAKPVVDQCASARSAA
jgi:hypothetical protein